MDADDKLLPADDSRRSFLGAMLGVGSAVIGALLAVPVLRYVFYPLTALSDDSEWTAVAPVKSFAAAQTPQRHSLELRRQDGWRETVTRPVIYIIKAGGSVKALSAICPHLGCTVPWDPKRNQFVCPCHGGTFAPDGARISGPPRRSLDSLDTKVSGGNLMVKYQSFRPDVSSKEVIS